MDKILVNIFDSVYDYDLSKKMSLLDVIWNISEKGKWKRAINKFRKEKDPKVKAELKKNLPAVTFSGTLAGTSRSDSNMDTYTKIVVIDLDNLSERDLKRCKYVLHKDAYTFGFFESPSRGLKVLFRVNSEMEFHKDYAFVQIAHYLKKNYEIVADLSGQNLSRLCFVSWDPDMHFNEFCDIFPVDTTKKAEKDKKDEAKFNSYQEISYDISHIFKVAKKMVDKSKTGGYYKDNRNNHIFTLSCVLNRAGVPQSDAFSIIYHHHHRLGQKEIEKTVGSAYKHNASDFGTKPIYKNKTSQKSLF